MTPRYCTMVKVIVDECVGCGACVDVCPQDAIVVDDVAVIDNDKCVECGACVDECPSNAIVE
jgi:ferredoxin